MASTRVNGKAAVKSRTLAPARDFEPEWTFLTNHAHVLLCIVREAEVRMRDVAQMVGITERAVQRIVADLEQAGYVVRTRQGRRNRYEIREHLPLRHPVERHERVSFLTALMHRKAEGPRRVRQ